MKDIYVAGKKMTLNGQKWSFMSHKFSEFFLPKLKKNGNKKEFFCVVAFDPIRI